MVIIMSRIMILMIILFFLQVASVEPVGMSVLRDRNQLFKINSAGYVENTYNLKVINKTQQLQTYTLNVSGLSDVTWYGNQTIQVDPGEVLNLPISLGVATENLNSPVSTSTVNWLLSVSIN